MAEDAAVSTSIGVQANDYEIERVTSRLPARRRVIPRKFRDFCEADAVKREIEEAEDPEYKPVISVTPRVKGRRRGRPRKITQDEDHAYPNGTEEAAADAPLFKEAKILLSKRFTCIVDGCHHVFVNARTLKKHTETMHSDEMKGKRIGRSSTTETDGKTDGKVRPFECSVCGKGFTQKGNLDLHSKIHTEQKSHACNVCGKTFRCMSSLRSHKKTHLGIKAYTCEVCNKAFSSNNTLKEHMALHTDTRPYICKVCSRSFRQSSCLNRHLKTHSDYKPFACNVCDKKFSQLAYVRSHMKSHTGERPFACSECGKKFAHLSDKNRHMIIHSGNKPFACTVCGALFSDSSARRRHCKHHETGGQKAFVCSLCPQETSFNRLAQLRAHNTRVHPKQGGGGVEVVLQEEGQEEVVINQVAYIDHQGIQIQYTQDEANEEVVAVLQDEEPPAAATEAVALTEDVAPEVFLFSNGKDYVTEPDFSSQDYFCWLAVFVDWTHQQTVPLDMDVFQKVSQVHKSLSDVMAQPQGALSDKDNFVSLMSMSCDLSAVVNAHLTCVLSSLSENATE